MSSRETRSEIQKKKAEDGRKSACGKLSWITNTYTSCLPFHDITNITLPGYLCTMTPFAVYVFFCRCITVSKKPQQKARKIKHRLARTNVFILILSTLSKLVNLWLNKMARYLTFQQYPSSFIPSYNIIVNTSELIIVCSRFMF